MSATRHRALAWLIRQEIPWWYWPGAAAIVGANALVWWLA